MKKYDVGCAIIQKKGKLLIAQRNAGDFLGGFWEFPGGKKEKNETFEECLVRELKEELGIEIRPYEFLQKTEHTYAHKKVALYFFLCDWVWGEPICHDCRDFKWITPSELRFYRFPLGDDEILNELIAKQAWYFGPHRLK